MLDRDLQLSWAVPTRGTDAARLMTKQELDADAAGEGRWRGERPIRDPQDEGKYLTLDARKAKAWADADVKPTSTCLCLPGR